VGDVGDDMAGSEWWCGVSKDGAEKEGGEVRASLERLQKEKKRVDAGGSSVGKRVPCKPHSLRFETPPPLC
jgi:hypothetical protein